MLVPKRVKHRREFRGKMRGEAKGGSGRVCPTGDADDFRCL